MGAYDDKLQELLNQMGRKKQLEARVSTLKKQREELADRTAELEQYKLAEQADVEKLEGRSLAAFFYAVIGKMDEKLDKERQEAYAAGVKYDAAARELEMVEEELRRSETELFSLQNCERRYEQVLQEKAAAIRINALKEAEEMQKLEENLASIENQKRELGEAIQAGKRAKQLAEEILSSLDSAEGWGTWDLLGGGLIADLAKHSDLDHAQELVEKLQLQLRRFKTELADVTIDADLQVNIEGFMRFADYFFDGLFADWAVLDKIEQATKQVRHTKNQIDSVLNYLQTLDRNAECDRNAVKRKLDVLIQSVEL